MLEAMNKAFQRSFLFPYDALKGLQNVSGLEVVSIVLTDSVFVTCGTGHDGRSWRATSCWGTLQTH